MKKARWPVWLTFLVLAAGCAYFIVTLDQAGIRTILQEHRAWIPMLLIIAVVTQMIKATRMYIIVMDTSLSYSKNLLLYATTTMINILLPYKVGELYRIALYGNQIGSYAGGTVRVLLDRAVDTAALLTFLTIIMFFQVSVVLPLYLLLLAMFVILCAAWLVFPQLYRFWNDFLITQRHSKSAPGLLKTLSEINRAYEYLRGLIRGRVFVMYLLSLAAWGLELIGIYILTVYAHNNSAAQISAYLTSALSTAANEHQKLYVLCYLVALGGMFCISAWMLKRRRAS